MRAADATRLIANGRVWSGVAGAARAGVGGEAVETAIAERDGRIAAVGSLRELRQQYPEAQVLDAGGRLVTPGLIDCHTHIVHAGNRAPEI